MNYIGKLAEELESLGVFNLMLRDSKYLYVFCSNRMAWITRRAPFKKARLIDMEVVIDFDRFTTQKDVVTVITSRPLTDNEDWNQMERGEFVVFEKGEVISG